MMRASFTRLAGLAVVTLAVGSIAGAQQAPKQPPRAAAANRTSPMPAARRDTTKVELGQEIPPVMREVFTYDGGGRRDPFFPLLLTTELRPFVSDLLLTSIIFDPTGRRSIAVMRDKGAGMQYRVTTGMMLGRMRVSEIRPKAVYFTIQEFGSDRRDSLLLVDTTKVKR